MLLAFHCIIFVQIDERQESAAAAQQYPPNRVCTNMNTFANDEEYRDFALLDLTATQLGKGLGLYQCYCKEWFKT